MDNLIKDIIYSSIKNLFQNQPDIFVNTKYTNFTEWNLSYHLSNELAKYIFWLDVDIDVSKRNYNNRRPDIIFHKRRTNLLNFLVVELKKVRNDNQSDISKLKEDWMREPLKYRFGAYINIWGKGNFNAIVLKGKERIEINDSCNYISVPKVNKDLLNECEKLLRGILSETEKTNLLDNLILKTFEEKPSINK